MLKDDSTKRGAAFLDGVAANEGPAAPDLPPPIRKRQAVSIEKLLSYEFPPREHVLAPVLSLGSLNMVFSWRGVGKTHFNLGAAYAIASGGAFLGWQSSRPFRVFFTSTAKCRERRFRRV